MSQSKPGSQADDVAPGERTFLVAEAGIAKEALKAAWHDTKVAIGRGVDPREWTGAHPLVALAMAAVGGFAAACAIVPTKEDQALNKLAALQRAVHGFKPDESVSDEKKNGKKSAQADEAAARKVGIAGLISAEALKAIRPLVTSVLSSMMAAKVAPQGSASTNGNASPHDANSHDGGTPSPT